MATRLVLAIRYHASLEEIQELINAQLDINEVDFYSLTPLKAAMIFYPEVIPLLMAHPQLDVNKRELDGKTPLFGVAIIGLDLSPFLTHPKIDVNARDKFEQVALHHAVSSNHPSAIRQFLADPRTDVSLKTYKGFTVVDMAKRLAPEVLPLFKREILTLMSPRVVPRLGGTSATRLPTEIMFQLNKMLYM